MGGCPVHISFGEAIVAAVIQTCDGCSKFEGTVPIERGPEAAFARRDRLQQIVVDGVVGLFGNMQLEREDLGVGVVDVACGFVDVGDGIRVDPVTEDVAIFVIAVEPKIGGSEILFVGEFTLDL